MKDEIELGPVGQFHRVIRKIEEERQNPKDLIARAARVEGLRTQPHITGGIAPTKIACIVAGVVVIGGVLFIAFKDKLPKPEKTWTDQLSRERDGAAVRDEVIHSDVSRQSITVRFSPPQASVR